jgi:hypothetical protein
MWLVKTEYFKIWHMISTALKIEELIYQIWVIEWIVMYSEGFAWFIHLSGLLNSHFVNLLIS